MSATDRPDMRPAAHDQPEPQTDTEQVDTAVFETAPLGTSQAAGPAASASEAETLAANVSAWAMPAQPPVPPARSVAEAAPTAATVPLPSTASHAPHAPASQTAGGVVGAIADPAPSWSGAATATATTGHTAPGLSAPGIRTAPGGVPDPGNGTVPGGLPAPSAGNVSGAPAAPPKSPRPRPRTGPIVWGALILVFCAYVAVRAAGGSIDAIAWVISTVLGLGVILLGVGLAVLIRGSGGRR